MARELRRGGSHYDVRTSKRQKSLWRKNFEGDIGKINVSKREKTKQNYSYDKLYWKSK